jgi:putative tryptophan/tyrosine transport system substrate-binding protein
MRRREFITLFGNAVAAWPLPARAEGPALPVIGFVHSSKQTTTRDLVIAFEQGLRETGYTIGQNVIVDYHWADDIYERLPAIFAGLVERRVSLIAAGTPLAARAAKQATSSIPIIFFVGSDPIKDGLVPNLNRPGGNITGATFFSNLLTAKRFELLHQFVPNAKAFYGLANPKNLNFQMQTTDAQEAAGALGIQLFMVNAATEDEIERSFETFKQRKAEALIIISDALLNNHAALIAKFALRYALPTCFSYRTPVADGGLMSYGASLTDNAHQAGVYAGRVLKGEKAGDLPVQQPAKFQFVINSTTAKALGLTIPPAILALADEVIE